MAYFFFRFAVFFFAVFLAAFFFAFGMSNDSSNVLSGLATHRPLKT